MPKVRKITPTYKIDVPEANYLTELFKRYMKAQKLTNEDVGKTINCTSQNISRILCKPTKEWTVEQLMTFSKALHCPSSEIFKALALTEGFENVR